MCPRSTTRASTDQPTCGTQKKMDTTHTHTPKLRAHASTSVTLGPPVAWMEGASGGLSLLQAGCNAATLRRGGSDVSLPDAIHDESQRCTHACQPRILPLLFPLPPTLFPLNGAWTALQGQHAHTHTHLHKSHAVLGGIPRPWSCPYRTLGGLSSPPCGPCG
jgi:hypothetical protein